FLKITTDEGLVGWSEFRESRRKGMRALIHGMSELLIGADPRAIGRLDASLYAHIRTVPGGMYQNAVGAILNACLDIKAKALGVLLDQIAAVREGAGPKFGIAIDLNFNYKAEGFRRIAKKVEPFELMWLEMDIYEPKVLALIRQSTTTPIASLETILGRRALIPYLQARCADVAIIDPQYNGLVESLRMAALADAYDVNCAPHYFAGPLAAVITAHFAAVIPNL